jgi:hypothetical protein
MGSTGSGRFTDYTGSQPTSKEKSSSGGGGGSGGVDRCEQAFSCMLEEVSLCDYLVNQGNPPAIKTALTIILNGRLFAVAPNGEQVGALPTRFNYLAACLEEGYRYVGVVTASSTTPMPNVSADFTVQ